MTFIKGRILYTEDDHDCREMVIFTLQQSHKLRVSRIDVRVLIGMYTQSSYVRYCLF